MSKCYKSNVTAKFLLSFALFLFSIFGVSAQTDITIGNGTSTNSGIGYPAPLQDYYEGSKMQYLFRASELTAAGMSPGNITALKFTVTSLNGFGGSIEQMAVKIGATTVASLNTTAFETITNQVLGPVNYVPVLGVNTLNFSTPFFWNGTDNVVIEICNGDPASTGGDTYTENPSVAVTTGLAFNASHTHVLDDAGNLCNLTSGANNGSANVNTRPNFTFAWVPAQSCSGMPNAGTITSSTTSGCVGQPFTLTATGVTVASGLTYQWQFFDGTTWQNITGANAISFTTTQSVTTQYRFQVACGADVATTAPITINSPAPVFGLYTINSSLPTAGRNFNSFNAAYDFIKCGIVGPVVFNVEGATTPYNEQLNMTAVPGSSAINTVTFQGNGRTIQFSSTNANSRAVIKLDSVKHVIFDSLTINAENGTFGYGIQLVRNSDSNIVRRCTILSSTTATNQNFAGIVVTGTDAGPISTGRTVSDYNIFSGNRINGGFYGITLTASFNGGANGFNLIEKNHITNFYSTGIYVAGSYNTTIDSNVLHRPTRASVGEFTGIHFAAEKNVNCIVSRNHVFNPFGAATASTTGFYGINFNASSGSQGSENIVMNNLIRNVNNAGPQYGIANTSSDYAYYLHNTVSLDSAGSTSSSLTRGISISGTPGGLAILNNIFSITRGGTGPKHVIYYGSSVLPVLMNHNNYYLNATAGTNNFIGYYTTNRLRLSDWQAATGMDNLSYAVFPAFDALYYPGNAAIDNKGLPVGFPPNDIYNNTRDLNAPDLGAVEFTAPPCLPPPVLGTTVLSRDTICQGSVIYFNLNIGAFGTGQIFQWQVSNTATGPFTDFGNPLVTPDTSFLADQSGFFRVKITCGAAVDYTNAVYLHVIPQLPMATYTINQNGNLTYVPGQAGGNFKTFNQTKTAMACGITGTVTFNVVVGSGPYLEQFRLDSIVHTGASQIYYRGNGETIAFSSSNANEKAVIKLNKTDRVMFDSLVIDARGAGTQGVGVHILNNADENTIINCKIYSPENSTTNNYAGVVINGSDGSILSTTASNSDNNSILNNTIIGGAYGVVSMGSATIQNISNQIIGNTIQEFNSHGIYLGPGNSNAIIEVNNISRPTRATAAATVYGIYANGTGGSGVVINRNRIHNLMGGMPTGTAITYGIMSDNASSNAGSPTVISNNAIYNTTGAGAVFGIGNTGSANINYYHNTISVDNGGPSVAGTARGFSQLTTATGIRFFNNIVSVTRESTGLRHALHFATTASVIESDYNDLFVTPGANSHIGFDGTNRTTLAAWQTATRDINSLSFDPGFVNIPAGNLIPVVAPLDNRGLPGLLAGAGLNDVDILNNARNNPPI
jgi:hypothetical protein